MTFNFPISIYILTIVIMRIILTYRHIGLRKIWKIQPHHYMHGLIIVLIYFLTRNPLLLAVGSALIVDEIPLFFIFHSWDWPDDQIWEKYHSWQCIAGVIFISLLGFLVLYL
jgi:hypothetical protein